MANSIRETKILLEGFRRFAIKEAEEGGGSNIVNIFDFDGTIFTLSDPDKARAMKNPWWLAHLPEEVLENSISETE